MVVSADCPAGGSAGDAEVDESSEVDRGDAGGECELVAFDAAVADTSVSAGDEPRDGSFDHGPVLAVVVGDVA